ncbi:MAG TPA: TIGR03085 family metal-binding protein [Micromonosporaceae bacterium]
MPQYARTERKALADLLSTVGPDAPTVAESWTARDLAAHLVVRERRPDAAPGILLRPLHGYQERVRRAVAALPFPRLVELVRTPPWWSPISNPLVDGPANTLEFYLHHEDVRRARPGWQPRDLPGGHQAALWRRTAALGRLRLRRFPARLLVQAPGHGEVTTGAGGVSARLIGTPGELALFLSGRQRVARVQIDAPAGLAERLRTADLSL